MSEKTQKQQGKVGDRVEGKWSDGRFYPGTIAKVGNGKYFIHYDDGDKGWTTKVRAAGERS